MKPETFRRYLFWILSLFQVLIGGTALFGGFSLMMTPDGSSLNLSLDILRDTPFTDYYVPGLLLFILIGLFHIAGALVTGIQLRLAGSLAVFLGITLLFWIIIQVAMIGYASLLQPLYFILGLAEMDLGVRWRHANAGSDN